MRAARVASPAPATDDAAALIDALDAAPAVVIGRSYRATVATDLALRYPDRVRALVLLEGDASREHAPAVAAWIDRLTDRLLAVAAQRAWTRSPRPSSRRSPTRARG